MYLSFLSFNQHLINYKFNVNSLIQENPLEFVCLTIDVRQQVKRGDKKKFLALSIAERSSG